MSCTNNKITLWSFLIVLIVTANCDNVTENGKHNSAENVDNVLIEPAQPFRGEYKSPVLNFLYSPGLSVQDIIILEEATWHWHPWKHVQVFVNQNGEEEEKECEVNSSIEDLPDDLFTQEQRQQGAVILHFLGAFYFFTILAIVCNDFFLPTVECICEDLGISEDVAAATFMAVASTTPEFFTNLISTFIADSDMGLGTIIGSMMFNTLGVAGCAGLAAIKPVQLDWYPMARDAIIYSINISTLVLIAWDGQVMWWETIILFVFFILYFVLLSQNTKIERVARNLMEKRLGCCKLNSYDIEGDVKSNVQSAPPPPPKPQLPPMSSLGPRLSKRRMSVCSIADAQIIVEEETVEETVAPPKTLWKVSRESKLKTFWWFYTWPIRFLLTFTVPNPRRMRNWYPLTFVLCILYIGLNSFMIYWMVAIIGYTFRIPETIMGMTLIAWGGCVQETIVSVIMIRQGRGGIGVSQSLGANSLAILMALGVPWFVRTMVDGAGYMGAFVNIYSYGIEFTIISLLLAVLLLYVVFACTKYRLKKIVGAYLLVIYVILISFAILVEMDILFPSGNRC